MLPVTYWPSRTATYWWDDVRRDEVARDFALAAAAGISHLHLAIPWEASQPHSERVSVPLMRDLEYVLRFASDAGLKCVVSFGVASIFGVLTLPHWFYELTADEHARPVRIMRRLFQDPAVIRGTVQLVSELTGEFGEHPVVEGWIIGDGMVSASPPRTEEQLAQWIDRMGAAMRLHGRRAWHGVSARDVAQQRSLRVKMLADLGLGLLVRVDWKPGWAHDTRRWAHFLASYVRALGGLPPLVIGTARFPVPERTRQGDEVLPTIHDVHAAGAAGIIWPAMFEYESSLRSRPPFTTAPGELTQGLFPRAGGLTSSAAAWIDAVHDPGSVRAIDWPSLDEELRERDPESFMRLAYGEFVA